MLFTLYAMNKRKPSNTATIRLAVEISSDVVKRWFSVKERSNKGQLAVVVRTGTSSLWVALYHFLDSNTVRGRLLKNFCFSKFSRALKSYSTWHWQKYFGELFIVHAENQTSEWAGLHFSNDDSFFFFLEKNFALLHGSRSCAKNN